MPNAKLKTLWIEPNPLSYPSYGRHGQRVYLGVGTDAQKDVPFILANGPQVARSIGFAIIRLDKLFTIDEVFSPKSETYNSWAHGLSKG